MILLLFIKFRMMQRQKWEWQFCDRICTVFKLFCCVKRKLSAFCFVFYRPSISLSFCEYCIYLITTSFHSVSNFYLLIPCVFPREILCALCFLYSIWNTNEFILLDYIRLEAALNKFIIIIWFWMSSRFFIA